MTYVIIGVALVVYLIACCLIGLMCSGDTRQHEATHQAGYEKRLRVLRDEAGIR